MTTNFDRLASDEPPFDPDADTAVDETTRPFETLTLRPPGALPVCRFMRPGDGFTVGPVVINSFAFRQFVNHGWRMITG